MPLRLLRAGSPVALPRAVAGEQSAVALTPIDGETISGGVQSNWASNGWYTRNGLTRATAWTGPNPVGANFAGMDDVNFIPVAGWGNDSPLDSFIDRMDDLGLNGAYVAAGSVPLASYASRGKFAVVEGVAWAGGTITNAQDPAVVGTSTGEEPSTIAGYNAIISSQNAWLATSDGPGRFSFFNFADQLMNGDIENTFYPADFVHATSPQFTCMDQYWFCGAPNDEGGSKTKMFFRLYVGTGGTATTDQTARGSNYGSSMDSIRKSYTPSNTSPFLVLVENGAPFTETTCAFITPAQMKWAIWSTLTHGSRGIVYFNHTFAEGYTPSRISSNNFNDDYYGGPGVAGTGIYAAAKEVNYNALTIAQVINSPFDGYFCYGDTVTGVISTTGFLTAVTSTNSRGMFAGVDASCKWHPTQHKHYILATTRESEATTNIPVTFRMVDQGQTTAVRLFDTTGSIGISRGGAIPGGFCEFSDTFATAASYKCYRID